MLVLMLRVAGYRPSPQPALFRIGIIIRSGLAVGLQISVPFGEIHGLHFFLENLVHFPGLLAGQAADADAGGVFPHLRQGGVGTADLLVVGEAFRDDLVILLASAAADGIPCAYPC